MNSLIIDLDHAKSNLVLDVILRVLYSLVDSSEDFLTGKRYNSLVVTVSHDRIGLARSCLSVGKETSMVSFKGIVKYFLTLF